MPEPEVDADEPPADGEVGSSEAPALPGGDLASAVAAALQAALERTGERPPSPNGAGPAATPPVPTGNEPLDLLDTSTAPWLKDPELGVQWAESWIASHPGETEPPPLAEVETPPEPATEPPAAAAPAAARPTEVPPERRTAAAAPPAAPVPAPPPPVTQRPPAPPPPEPGWSGAPWERPYEPRSLERLFRPETPVPAPVPVAVGAVPEPVVEAPTPAPRRKPRRRPLTRGEWLTALAAGLVIGLMAGLLAYAFGPAVQDVYLTRYVVPVNELPAPLEGLRVVQVSDLHLPGRPQVTASAAKLVQEAAPDVLLLTGDVLDDATPEALAALDGFLSSVHASRGSFAVAGEREAAILAPLREAYERHGVRLLANERATLEFGEARLVIAGFDAPPERAAEITPVAAGPHTELADLVELARRTVEIWMVHAPQTLVDTPRENMKKAAFIVAGHTLGGELGMPSLRSPSRYRSGWYSLDLTRLYVSNGVGTGRVPARLFAPAEVTRFTLRKAERPYATPIRDTAR